MDNYEGLRKKLAEQKFPCKYMFKFITLEENLAELTQVARPVNAPDTGFGTVINKHPSNHDQVWRQTSQGEAHGYGAPVTAQTV